MMNEIEAAFADGRLRLEVDAPQPYGRNLAAFVGDVAVLAGEPVQIIHVMSRPAKGEIRGYVLTVTDGQLHVRTPCYSGHWPDLDEAVLARVPGARAMLPYTTDHGTVRHQP